MDVAPALLEKVTKAFSAALATDRTIKALLGKLETGKATYPDAEAYSARVGELLAAAVASEIAGTVLPDGRMYYNIAEKVLGPSLKANHDNVTDYCKPLQERMNKEAGLTIKYIKPKFDEDRANGIYIYASRHDDFDSIKGSLGAVITNFTQHSVDESIRVNAEFQARAGYKAKIIRTAEANCCEWCNDLEGEYEYPDGIPENVFARHDNCRCVVEYQIGDRAQDVWTKRWREAENEEKVKEREKIEKGETHHRKSDIITNKAFRTSSDPMREVSGSAEDSNPRELREMLAEIKEKGAEVKYREGEISYQPALIAGVPGTIIAEPGMSFSAWKHEYRHLIDDEKDGYPGFRIFEDSEKCAQREIDAYQIEIEDARKAGREDIAEKLIKLRDQEIEKYRE